MKKSLKNRLLRIAETLEKLDVEAFTLPEAVAEFFKDNKAVTIAEAKAYAKELGVECEEFNIEVYKLLSALINSNDTLIGKHRDVSDDNFDPKELKMGIEIEMEHTDNPAIAKEVAKDHLSEIKNYYTLLKEMEAKGADAEGCVGCGDEVDGCEGCKEDDIAEFGSSSCADCQKILSEFLSEE